MQSFLFISFLSSSLFSYVLTILSPQIRFVAQIISHSQTYLNSNCLCPHLLHCLSACFCPCREFIGTLTTQVSTWGLKLFRVVISVGAKRVPLALSTLCTPGRQNETPAAVPSACFPFCLFSKILRIGFCENKKPMQFHLLQKSKIHRLNPLT